MSSLDDRRARLSADDRADIDRIKAEMEIEAEQYRATRTAAELDD
jgi:hypothetical protein